MQPGSKLGSYEIVSPIGKGGMGEVWKARDPQLGRDVAIKVSAQQFTDRFEREARAIAALNHANVCTLYHIGPNYLVMEYIEGATLAERIQEGPIPLEEALGIAKQIADALEAAHEKGIVHRDLKPANVKIRPDGSVKVLDFGLAKAGDAQEVTADSPTMMPGTKMGMILGTAGYMSPEQARGKVVDKRADIWAFGVVLYEMVTGKRLFEGETVSDSLASILKVEPDLTLAPEKTRRLLSRCLEKDPNKRLRWIGDWAELLEDRTAIPTPPASPPRWGWRAMAAVVLTAVVSIAATRLLWRDAASPVWTASILGGPTHSKYPRLSPDGQLLAFYAFIDELPQLGVMKPDGGSWTMLTAARDSGYVTAISWSPDGSKIYFDRYWGHPRGVFSVPPLGGEPRLLLDDAFDPESLPDGSLIVARLTDQGDHQLFHFWPESGKLEPLPAFITPADVGNIVRASPDGKEIVYFGEGGPETRNQSPNVYVFDLASHVSRRLLPGAKTIKGPVTLTPDGRLAYANETVGDLMQLVSVPRRGSGPRRVLMSFPGTAGPSNIDVSRDGSLYLDQEPALRSGVRFTEGGSAAFSGEQRMSLSNGDFAFSQTQGGKSRLMVQHAGAQPHMLLQTTEESAGPVAELPGGMIAFVLGSGDERHIAVATLRDGRVMRRFAPPAAAVTSIAATPDASEIFYSSGGHIWSQRIAGGEPRQITAGTDAAVDAAGRFLYVKRNEKGVIKLFRTSLAGGDSEELLIPGEYHLANPPLNPTAIDSKGRILLTVISAHSFYYHAAIFDPRTRDLRLPLDFDGDVYTPGWLPDGRIEAAAQRYTSSLWRYRPVR